MTSDMDDPTAAMALHQLSIFLSRFYGKKVIILLDEYGLGDNRKLVKIW